MRALIIVLLLVSVVHAADIEDAVRKEVEKEGVAKVIVEMQEIPEPNVLSKASPERRQQQMEARSERIRHEHEKLLKRLGIQEELRSYSVVNAFCGTVNSESLAKLAMEPDIKKIYLDRVLTVELNDSREIIHADSTNELRLDKTRLTGRGQTACVVDTGIDYNHTSLGGGWGSVVIDGYDYANDDSDPMDDNSHGTHVAGIIASRDESYSGIAPESKLVALKVCDMYGSCPGSDMIAGVDWCVANSAKYNITAITISIGDSGSYDSDSCPTWMESALRNAAEAGIIITVSSGNNYHKDGVSYPACSQYVIAAGAVSKALEVPEYSNSGECLDLLAPGGTSDAKIISTKLTGGFAAKYGTSMAAPHVAAAVALLQQFSLLQDSRLLTLSETLAVLNSSGTSIRDQYNNVSSTLIDAYSAVIAMDNKPPTINITIADRIKVQQSSYAIRVTGNEFLSSCHLQWNGENLSMQTVENNCSITAVGSGYYSYKVFANDSAGNFCQSTTQEILLNDTSPVITSFYPNISIANIREPESLGFNITYIEPNNQNVTILWTRNDTAMSNISYYNFSGSYASAGSYLIKVILNDSILATEHNWTLIVNNTNRQPAIESAQILPINPGVNSDLVCQVTSSDPDNDSLSYFFDWHSEAWKSYNTMTLYRSNLTYNSSWNCSAIAFDGYENSTRVTSSQVSVVNSEPNITYFSPEKAISIIEPNNISFRINASDEGLLTMTWIVNGQNKSSGSNNYTIKGNYSTAGYYEITALVCDGSLTANVTWLLTINNTNRQPVPNPIGQMRAYINTNITINLSKYFSDPDMDNLSFGASASENISVMLQGPIANILPLENWTGLGHALFNSTDGESVVENRLNLSFTKDLDLDGHPAISQLGDDCNDNDTLVYPGAGCTRKCYTNSKYDSNCACTGGSFNCGGGGSGGGGGAAIIAQQKQSIREEKQEVKTIFLVSQKTAAATRIVINATRNNVTITVRKADVQGDDSYAYFEITHDSLNESDINNVEIFFRVNSTWLESRDKDTVMLHRLEEAWHKLETRLVNDTGLYTEYASKSPGLSLFKITAERKALENTNINLSSTINAAAIEQPKKVAAEPEQEGFALIALIAATLSLAVFTYNHYVTGKRFARLEEYIYHKLRNKKKAVKILEELGWEKKHINKCAEKASKRIRKAAAKYPRNSPSEEGSPPQGEDRQCSQNSQQKENSPKH
ncbi:MAG: S8 family serine peptidase [Candidatus Woesearchaeota archaeon]